MRSRTQCLIALLIAALGVLQGCDTMPQKAIPAPVAEMPEPPPEPQPVIVPEEEAAPETPAPPVAVEVEEPKPAAQPPVVCPPPQPSKPAKPERPQSVIPILGSVEYATIDPPGLSVEAQLDTGAATSSLDARNIRQFERDGKQWVKFQIIDRKTQRPLEVSRPVVLIATSKGKPSSKRYVVTLRTRIATIDQFVEYSLSDRSASSHAMVLGRNFLRDQALVDVGRRYTAGSAQP